MKCHTRPQFGVMSGGVATVRICALPGTPRRMVGLMAQGLPGPLESRRRMLRVRLPGNPGAPRDAFSSQTISAGCNGTIRTRRCRPPRSGNGRTNPFCVFGARTSAVPHWRWIRYGSRTRPPISAVVTHRVGWLALTFVTDQDEARVPCLQAACQALDCIVSDIIGDRGQGEYRFHPEFVTITTSVFGLASQSRVTKRRPAYRYRSARLWPNASRD